MEFYNLSSTIFLLGRNFSVSRLEFFLLMGQLEKPRRQTPEPGVLKEKFLLAVTVKIASTASDHKALKRHFNCSKLPY